MYILKNMNTTVNFEHIFYMLIKVNTINLQNNPSALTKVKGPGSEHNI